MYRTTRRCFVVTRSTTDREPLRIEWEYQHARAYVLAFNRINRSGKAVIRPGTAAISYCPQTEVALT